MKKATSPDQVTELEQIPNIGVSIASDLKKIGVKKAEQLKYKDPYQLYEQLCEFTKSYHDPCVLDTFISAVHFMQGKGARPWWKFTPERKKRYHQIQSLAEKWK